MKASHKTIFVLISCLAVFAAMPAFAANLFFEAKSQGFTQGDEFLVNVFLNTDGESVNAAEGKVFFPPQILEIKEVRDGDSIINFWIERPKASNGEILFSGIVPGGYQDAKGFLFSVVFHAKADGAGAVEMRGARALLNDGQGTPANLTTPPFQFSVSPATSTAPSKIEAVEDNEPPEEFRPGIAQSPELFDGKYFLVFATQDKGSGIDRYEAREGEGPFVAAESPYVLRNQNLDEKIFVKAVDKAGNVRAEILYPPNFRPWYRSYWIFGILMIGAMFVAWIAGKILWRRFSK